MSKNLLLALIPVLAVLNLQAQSSDNPLDGYTGETNSFFLSYVNGTGFGPSNPGDVQVRVNIGGVNSLGDTNINDIGGVSLNVNVDTGSRGLFVSDDTLGGTVVTNSGSFFGTIDLTSSQRVYTGYYTTESVNFAVTDQNGNNTIATANVPILDVQTLGSEAMGSATYTSPQATGTLELVGGGTLSITGNSFVLTNGQQVSYTNSSNHGLLPSVSNFGVGFYLGGNSTTGPVGNNTNQILNALINLTNMTNGSMVAGYVVTPTGIQLGLTQNTTNFAYTALQPTGLTNAPSLNTPPDWTPSTGQVVVNGVTNGPGSVVLDSGISNSYMSLTNPSGWIHDGSNSISVNLLNSAGAVGYSFGTDTNNSVDSNSLAGPASVSEYGSTNTYYNSGRNIFNAFDMLYDAQDGYLGLTTNQYGATNTSVTFQAGFYSVPEPAVYFLLGLGALVLVVVYRRRV